MRNKKKYICIHDSGSVDFDDIVWINRQRVVRIAKESGSAYTGAVDVDLVNPAHVRNATWMMCMNYAPYFEYDGLYWECAEAEEDPDEEMEEEMEMEE